MSKRPSAAVNITQTRSLLLVLLNIHARCTVFDLDQSAVFLFTLSISFHSLPRIRTSSVLYLGLFCNDAVEQRRQFSKGQEPLDVYNSNPVSVNIYTLVGSMYSDLVDSKLQSRGHSCNPSCISRLTIYLDSQIIKSAVFVFFI